jgi:hypothetical protein
MEICGFESLIGCGTPFFQAGGTTQTFEDGESLLLNQRTSKRGLFHAARFGFCVEISVETTLCSISISRFGCGAGFKSAYQGNAIP